MEAIGWQSHSVLRFRNLSSFAIRPKLGNPIVFSQSLLHFAETEDIHWSVEEEEKELRSLTALSCFGSNGNRRNRPPRRRSSSRKIQEGNDEKSPVNDKLNSASQEEIISIFRRIQSSISKEDSFGYDTTDSNVSDKKSPVSSILKTLRESGKNQGKGNKNEGAGMRLTRRGSVAKKEESFDSKLTRPVSKFVRRSPIPSPTSLRGFVSLEFSDKISSTSVGTEELKLPKIEELKLSELKEMAKSRGIKGYSRLKKSDLISLLRS